MFISTLSLIGQLLILFSVVAVIMHPIIEKHIPSQIVEASVLLGSVIGLGLIIISAFLKII